MYGSELADALRIQARSCARHGSPLYAELLARAAEDVLAGGPCAALLDGWQGHPVLDALGLRLLGAAHALVLSGAAPELARFYPTAGGTPDAAGAWRALRSLIALRPAALRPSLAQGVQTNEVRRSTVLLGGFLHAAERTRLPLRLLELGASAGLNLLFDRYRYDLAGLAYGDPSSPVLLSAGWSGALPPRGAPLVVASRAGCDLAPVDLHDPDQRLRLESFLWPDQPERLALLRRAVTVALADPPSVARSTASAWLAKRLPEPVPGRTSLIFHSVIWFYLSESERAEVTRLVEAAGAGASARAPIAWLRLEGASLESAELRLRLWPDGEDRLLARTDYHGRATEWL